MDTFRKIITLIFGTSLLVVSVAVFLGALVAIPVMLLWDYTMPILFDVPEITWLQAWALYILCVILFKTSVTEKK